MSKRNNIRLRDLDYEEGTAWLQDEDALVVTELANSKLLSYENIFALTFILALGIAIGLLINNSYHNNYLQIHAIDGAELDLFKAVSFPSHPTRFNGSLFHRSKYAGLPSPQLDGAWARYTETGNEYMPHYPALLRISAHDVELSSTNPIEAAVKFEDSEGGGYMATLGMYHEIHCLEMLRRFIYFDHYAALDPEWANAPLLREHTDHCLDMLRELLMCRADTTLITYHWRKGFSGPVPDFSTRQICRDPEDVLKWTRENEVKIRREVARPEGVEELEHDF